MNKLPPLSAHFFFGKLLRPESGKFVHWALIGCFGKPLLSSTIQASCEVLTKLANIRFHFSFVRLYKIMFVK
jgi:hypothetical protein